MRALLAIHSYQNQINPDDGFVRRALAWIGDKTEGESTEWWATRLMLENSIENTDRAKEIRRGLIARQNEDGGWGWLHSDSSDAFGTGLALYALSRDGGVDVKIPIGQAIKFLQETQDEDGSWSVNGTKKADRDHETPTATYWGTCWAVIGLAETISGHPIQTHRMGQ